jgi:molybdate transport system substrate-binding protein
MDGMIMILRAFVLVFLAFAPAAQAASHSRGPLVLAAASMQEAMTAAAAAWAAKGHARPVLSFAGSSALARQIRAGAPADLFVSADEAWMTDVERGGFVARGTRANIAGNRLILIAPASKPVRLRIARGMPIGRALGKGRIAMANPDAVPAGRYGKAALISLGVWSQVQGRIARGENVRTALALVERGEAPLGIVYATDARAARNVTVVGAFPPGSHPPIRYPLARLTASRNPEAEGFRRFLLSPAGRAMLVRYGFTAPR